MEQAEGRGSKQRTTALIVAAMAAILLLCACAGGAALLLLAPVDRRTSDTVAPRDDERADTERETAPSRDGRDSEDVRVQQWRDWDPDAPPVLDGAPASHDAYVDEALGIMAPDFAVDDAVWLPGEYDAAYDWYYGDAVYVRARHPSSESVSAAIELWIQSDEMIDEDVTFEAEQGEFVTKIADGSRELLYIPQWGPMGFQLRDEDEVDLWRQIGIDWPDAVVTEATSEDNVFTVSITKWRVYAVDGAYPIVSVTYQAIDDHWTIVEWDYWYPGDDEQLAV